MVRKKVTPPESRGAACWCILRAMLFSPPRPVKTSRFFPPGQTLCTGFRLARKTTLGVVFRFDQDNPAGRK
jgi:hypothetical protein